MLYDIGLGRMDDVHFPLSPDTFCLGWPASVICACNHIAQGTKNSEHPVLRNGHTLRYLLEGHDHTDLPS